jgi:hypothetical protein
MTFIAITPCRVMDTRTGQGFTGAFGPPSLAGSSNRVVPMPSSTTCSIPFNAGAYSLNITVVPPGPLSFLSVWPAGAPYPNVSTLNDPTPGGVIANAAIIVAGTGGAIQMFSSDPTDVIIDINGYYTDPTDLSFSTAIGNLALAHNSGGNSDTALGDSALLDNTSGSYNTATGANALASNTTGNYNTATGYQALVSNVSGTYNTAVGYQALQNSTASQNTATGAFALQQSTTGSNNTATGYEALENTIGGSNNTADGRLALASNTAGTGNVAVGGSALQSSTEDMNNTALGYVALANNNGGSNNTAVGEAAAAANIDGYFNTAVGYEALDENVHGFQNTAVGDGALFYNTVGSSNTAVGGAALLNVSGSGSNNIGIGYQGGNNIIGGSNNIEIGSQGALADGIGSTGVIRIGTSGTGGQSSFFAAGISGVNVSGATVVVNSSGQLGVVVSSERFKKDIEDMGDASSALLQLRPVTFRYKQPYDDGSNPLDYGLIAEEVADVYPDLVVKDGDGKIETIQYQKLTPMLLNEVQKQAAQIHSLEDRLAALEALLASRQ